MTESNFVLPSSILALCDCCSERERKSIVAYCCHLSFTDRSVRRLETDFVRAIAERMQVTSLETAQMARLARRKRLRIKIPKSEAGRQLMFHLALRMAIIDDELDARERSAIQHLARQLGIPAETVAEEIEKVQTSNSPSAETPSSATSPRNPSRESQNQSKGFFARLFDSLTTDWILEDLEAILYTYPNLMSSTEMGEVEYTLTRDGEIALEIELNSLDLPSGETVSVLVSDRHVCDIHLAGERIDQTIRAHDHEVIPKISRGDAAEIHHRGKTILRGVFDST